MNGMQFDAAMMLTCTAVALLALLTPAGRDAWRNYLLLARRLYVEFPLRLVTGRRRPDYQLIGTLQREVDKGADQS